MKHFSILLALFLASCLEAAQVSIPARQWIARPIPSNGIAPARGGNAKHISLAWNSDDGWIYFHGGDHAGSNSSITADSGRQEMYRYNVASDQWELLQDFCRADKGIQPSGPDETGWTYDSRRKVFWMVPGYQWSVASYSVFCPGSQLLQGVTMGFDPATRTWSAPTFAPEPPRGSHDGDFIQYDPVTDALLRVINDGVEVYSFASNTWAKFGFSAPNFAFYDVGTTIDIVGRRLYWLGASHLYSYNIDTHLTTDLGAAPDQTGGENKPIWDSVNRVLLWPVFSDTDTSTGAAQEKVRLHAYDPASGKWETNIGSSSAGTVPVKGRHAIFDHGQNALLVMANAWNKPTEPYVFLFRYAAAGPLDAIQPGEWYKTATNHIRDVLPNPLPPGGTGPASITTAWNSAIYDTSRDRYCIADAGGHGDYAGNEVYCLSLSTLAWERIWGPTPNSLIQDLIAVPCSPAYLDGNPRSRHTYDAPVYLPLQDKIFLHGGSLWCGSGGFGNDSWVFDFATLAWSQRANANGFQNAVPFSAYDPVTGHVFTHRYATLGEYDPVADTWVSRGGFSAGIDPNATFVLDPVRRKIFFIGGGAVRVYDISLANTQLTIVTTTGDTAPVNVSRPGAAYDPVSGKIIVWIGGSDVYAFDTGSLVWTKVLAATTNLITPTLPTANGTFKRWQYVPAKNLFVIVNSIDGDTYFYKLGTVTSPGPGPGPTPEPPSLPPIGWWKLDGDAQDSSSQGNNGTLVNAPSFQVGHAGQAINLNGSTQSILIGTQAIYNDMPAFTVAAWMFPRTTGASQRGCMICKLNGAAGWGLRFDATGSPRLWFFMDRATTDQYKITSITLSLNAWSHVAVTFNGIVIRIYVNGSEATYSQDVAGAGSRMSDATRSLRIGNQDNDLNGFDGLADDVQLYAAALPAAQLLGIYNGLQYSPGAPEAPNNAPGQFSILMR